MLPNAAFNLNRTRGQGFRSPGPFRLIGLLLRDSARDDTRSAQHRSACLFSGKTHPFSDMDSYHQQQTPAGVNMFDKKRCNH